MVSDYEASGNASHSLLLQFLEEVESITGRVPMIYTSPGFWNAHGSASKKWLKYRMWEAHYTSAMRPMKIEPWGNDWTFWQHGVYPVGKIHGAESTNLDLDWFNGSMAELLALAGETEPIEPPLPPEIEIRVDRVEGRLDAYELWAKNIGFK